MSGVIRSACLLGLLLGAALQQGPAIAQHSHPLPMARASVGTAAPEATLRDQDGQRLALKDLRGKAGLVAFIYTSCHHVCPLIVESVTATQQRAGKQGMGDLRAVYVTVDPEIDTPEVLKAYAARRSADLSTSVFLTGSEQELKPVWDGFGVKVKRLGRGLVDHPPLTFLVDAQGVIRYRYTGTMLDSEVVVADLRRAVQATAK